MASHLSENERKAQVINAALEVIYKEGIEKLTLDKISLAAQCSKGVAAYYYKTKDNIIHEAYRAFLTHYQQRTAKELEGSTSPQHMLSVLIDVAFPPRQDPDDPHHPIHLQSYTLDEHQESVLFMQFFCAAINQPALQKILIETYSSDAQGIGSLLDYFQQVKHINPSSSFSNVERAYGFLAMVVGLSFFRVGNILTSHPSIDRDGQGSLDRRLLRAYLDDLASGR